MERRIHRGLFAKPALLLMLLILYLGISQSAYAEDRAPITPGTIGTQKLLGIGLQSGTISGISVKYFLNSSNALQFGIGGSPWWGFGLNAEYLVHPYSLASGPGANIPLYIGIGIGLGRYNYYDYDGANVHVPLGAAIEFKQFPVDVFVQAEPGFGFGKKYAKFYGGGTVGARLYF